MQRKNLMLIGDRGIGKSTIIRENIICYLKNIDGFFSQRILINGQKVGHRLCDINSIDISKYDLNIEVNNIDLVDNVFVNKRADGTFNFNKGTFVQEMNKILDKQFESRLIILDEIGGMELAIKEIKDKLFAILDSNIPVLGVIKSNKNLNSMMNNVINHNIDDKFYNNYNLLVNRNDIDITNINEVNRESVNKKVFDFVNKVFISG